MEVTNELYNKYINLLRKIAWSYNRSTGIEWEELMSEITVAFITAVHTYNKEKGAALSTWITTCAQNHINNYIQKEKRIRNNIYSYFDEDFIETMEAPDQFEKIHYFQDLLDGLSENAKVVCSMIINDPESILENTPKASRGKLQRKLREQNWSWSKIWNVINELKMAVNP